jgi:two-component system, OmpR family, phosphate regulon sensor histidine kinase PhoR
MFTAKTIRIFSTVGIILLLVLQYVWFKNSYVLMEHDIIQKSETNLTKAVENELFERINKASILISLQNKNTEGLKFVKQGHIDQSKDINNGLQNLLIMMGKPCSIQRVDTLYNNMMIESIGFAPNHSIRMITADQKEKSHLSKFLIFSKITDKQYVEVTLISPLGSILRQAQIILISSILLVIMIGIILISQLRSMLRENRFVDFIRDYTHALTHELKTPISGIYMSASQLASGKLEDRPESRKHHYQMCKDQSAKLLATVDRILLVAKAEQSKITPNIISVELKDFVDKIAETHRQNNFRNKDVEIVTYYERDDMTGMFDSFLMENVLNNLIDNAVKYSDQSVRISIFCSYISDKLQISVKDNGFGIAEKDQKSIFDNFERGNKVQGKGIDGFGIGLNYVSKVIKAHKGQISVKSKEGAGSEFIIVLPIK